MKYVLQEYENTPQKDSGSLYDPEADSQTLTSSQSQPSSSQGNVEYGMIISLQLLILQKA